MILVMDWDYVCHHFRLWAQHFGRNRLWPAVKTPLDGCVCFCRRPFSIRARLRLLDRELDLGDGVPVGLADVLSIAQIDFPA